MGWVKWVAALAAPMLLTGCFFAPGKFESELDIGADGRFSFAYRGEIVAVMPDGPVSPPKPRANTASATDGDNPEPSAADTAEAAAAEARRKAEARAELLAALRREPGYGRVEDRGDDIFYVEYTATGTLTHNFVWPYNQDAGLVMPFVALERRQDGHIRATAPAFGASAMAEGMGQLGGLAMLGQMGAKRDAPSGSGGNTPPRDPSARRDGRFTVTTDAPIIMQNQESGARPAPNGKQSVTWRVTSTNKTVPTIIVRGQP